MHGLQVMSVDVDGQEVTRVHCHKEARSVRLRLGSDSRKVGVRIRTKSIDNQCFHEDGSCKLFVACNGLHKDY